MHLTRRSIEKSAKINESVNKKSFHDKIKMNGEIFIIDFLQNQIYDIKEF